MAKRTNEQFLAELNEICGGIYEPLEKFKTTKTKMNVKCKVHNEIWSAKPEKLLIGQGCPKCRYEKAASKRRKTVEQYKKEIFELTDGEYSVLENEYKNAHTKMMMRHNGCGHEWEVVPNSFLNGSRCPKCNCSKMEKATLKVLNKLKLNHKHSIRFNDLKDKHTLEIDHIIYNELGGIELAIECNGEQHYKHCPHFHVGGRKSLENQIKHDNKKALYCVENNIPLLVIPYWELKNIEKIITSHPIIRKLVGA